MSTLTDFRSLVQPVLSDLGPQTIEDLAANFAILDLSSLVVCTSGSRPSGVAGTTIFETDTNKIWVYTTAWKLIWQLGWTTYTPTWTATGSNPVIGNGTLSGAYRQSGQSIEIRIQVLTGSTTTLGTGSWELALPVAPLTGLRQAISGFINDGSSGTTTRWAVSGMIPTDASLLIDRIATSANTLSATTPMSWATGTRLCLNGVYEAN